MPDLARRWVVTLGGLFITVVLLSLPVAGMSHDMFLRTGRGTPFTVLPVGVTPFITGFLLVELIALLVPGLQTMRVRSQKGRRGLDLAGRILCVGFLLLQLGGLYRTATAFAGEGELQLPPPALLWAQWLLGYGLLVGVVMLVNREGLGDGFAVLLVATILREVQGGGAKVLDAVRSEAVSIGVVFGFVLLIGFGLRFVAREWSRRPEGGDLPTSATQPISTATAWLSGVALINVLFSLQAWVPGLGPITRTLSANAVLTTGLIVFFAFDLALLYGFLFFRPQAVGRIWKQWRPELDETAAVSAARLALPRALMLSIGITVGMPAALQLLAVFTTQMSFGAVVDLFLLLAWILDVRSEHLARSSKPNLVEVHDVQRVAEVDAVTSALRAAGVESFARGLHFRATQQLFLPPSPVRILVKSEDVERARALVKEREPK